MSSPTPLASRHRRRLSLTQPTYTETGFELPAEELNAWLETPAAAEPTCETAAAVEPEPDPAQQALEERLRRLEERSCELERRLAAAAVPAEAPAPAGAPAVPAWRGLAAAGTAAVAVAALVVAVPRPKAGAPRPQTVAAPSRAQAAAKPLPGPAVTVKEAPPSNASALTAAVSRDPAFDRPAARVLRALR